MSSAIFLHVTTGRRSLFILFLRSLNCLRTTSADFSSLNDRIIRRGAFAWASQICCWLRGSLWAYWWSSDGITPWADHGGNTFMCSIEEKVESEDKLPSIVLREIRGWQLNCYGFPCNIKRGRPSNQLHDGGGKEQQTIFHWNRAHKTWKTADGNVSPGKRQTRAYFFAIKVTFMPVINDLS